MTSAKPSSSNHCCKRVLEAGDPGLAARRSKSRMRGDRLQVNSCQGGIGQDKGEDDAAAHRQGEHTLEGGSDRCRSEILRYPEPRKERRHLGIKRDSPSPCRSVVRSKSMGQKATFAGMATRACCR